VSRSHTTIAALEQRHHLERRRLVLGALERNEWSLARTAVELAVPVSSLQRLIERHELAGVYAQHAPGRRGQPPKAAE
jgi:transcriptional regulator with GAF, ATPase, and Fis domain